MQASRSIYKVENQKLVIELPASFEYTEVEVIILPVKGDESNPPDASNQASKAGKTSFGRVWDETDEQSVLESQHFINQWT